MVCHPRSVAAGTRRARRRVTKTWSRMPTKTTTPERVRMPVPATRNGRVDPVGPPGPAAPPRADGRAAALRAGRRALARVPGYRELVASQGGRADRLRDLSE